MLWDCHIHMVLDGLDWRAAIGRHKENPREDWIRGVLQEYVRQGFGYLRDGGDRWGVGARARELAGTYGIVYRTPLAPLYHRGHYGAFIGTGYENLREYAALVQRQRELGADFIKIMISGLMDFDCYGRITSEPLDPAEIRELIRIAHAEGFAVMAHANGADTVKTAVEAGVDSIEHGAYLDDEAVRMLAQSDTIWVPTLVTIGNLIGEGRYPDAVLRPLLRLQMDNVAECARLGGKIALGSDAGAYRVFHTQGALDEYGYLKRAIGAETDQVLKYGENMIQNLFKID